MNFELKQQQCYIICIQFKLRANKIIQDMNPAFSSDPSMLNLYTAVTNGRSATNARPSYAAILPHSIYESSSWTSKEVYETFHNHNPVSVTLEAGMHQQQRMTQKLLF